MKLMEEAAMMIFSRDWFENRKWLQKVEVVVKFVVHKIYIGSHTFDAAKAGGFVIIRLTVTKNPCVIIVESSLCRRQSESV